jgi:hypothetical protein
MAYVVNSLISAGVLFVLGLIIAKGRRVSQLSIYACCQLNNKTNAREHSKQANSSSNIWQAWRYIQWIILPLSSLGAASQKTLLADHAEIIVANKVETTALA